MELAESGLDLAAVSRVARNIDLRDIRVVQVAASCSPAPEGAIEPQITFNCKGALVTATQLNVACDYFFKATSAGVQAALVNVTYLLRYEVVGDALAERDVDQFANVNGVYHSWPFLRQFLFDITAKMGLPPLTLPVFQVLPKKKTVRSDQQPLPKKRKPAPRKALSE